jgi:iron complex outermembrane receptor protein
MTKVPAKKLKVAVIGSGNIGTDLMIKILRTSTLLEMAALVREIGVFMEPGGHLHAYVENPSPFFFGAKGSIRITDRLISLIHFLRYGRWIRSLPELIEGIRDELGRPRRKLKHPNCSSMHKKNNKFRGSAMVVYLQKKRSRIAVRRARLFSVIGSTLLVAISTPVFAQGVQAGATEEVVVSSTRLRATGFEAPTPTTVVGTDFIEKQAKDNLFNVITELPSMMGSTGQQVGSNGTSGGTNGLSSFNMFGLGAVRTLTLLDGQRVVPANVQGIPDISLFPQLLVERVDVVTGGASASYGSDAISGVVNFITNKKFEGFKANISGGISTYADNKSGQIQAAWGTSFADERGHFEIAGEYNHTDGVGINPTLGCCTNALAGGRTWFTSPTRLQYSTPAVTPAGQPQYYNTFVGQHYQLGRYGLITNGPLQGTGFGVNGSPYQFQYGVGPNGLPGVAGKNVAGSVSNCVNPFCIGGQTDGIIGAGVTLAFPLTRGDIYSRISYDITPDINVYASVNWAAINTSNVPNPDAWKTGQNIPCDNAYLPGTGIFGANLTQAATQAACLTTYPVAQYPGGFQFGSDYQNLGPQVVFTDRAQRRYVGGATGKLSVFDIDWDWDTYFQHGENDTNIKVRNITLKPYFNASIDAVNGAGGTIVCRSTVAQSLGCQPFNPFGQVTPTQATLNWLYGGSLHGPGPLQISHQAEDAASFSVNASPFKNWAGDISIAAGIEWRQEAYDVTGDNAGNGNAQIPGTPPITPCTDPLLDCVNGTNWYAGSFHNGRGYYNVSEGFLEFGVPLINSTTWGKADLDIAGRLASYSTSGQAITWKVGVTYDTPIEGVRLRALQSRDVRAPNLSELFAAPTTANGTDQNPYTNVQNQVVNATVGNPLLKQEKSQNTQVGLVYQPTFIPGFSLSADYYRIAIKGQISTIPQQTSINLCFSGLTQYCAAIVTKPPGQALGPGVVFGQVTSQAFNVASTVTDGVNYEASYQFDLSAFTLPGNIVLRLLATNVSKFITDPGLPGQIPLETAGANDGATPHWKFFGTQTYNIDAFSLTLSEQWISQGTHARNFVECTPGSCPASTLTNPTINNNYVPSVFYMNVGGSYDIDDHWKVYAQVDNVFDKSPPPFYSNSQNPTEDGVNTLLYDDIGRMFHVGARVNY